MPITIEFKRAFDVLYNVSAKLEKKVPPAVEKSVNYAVDNISKELAIRIRAELRKNGKHLGGLHSYRRYRPYWTPSKPGTPPARISDALLNSVTIDSSGMSSTGAGAIFRGSQGDNRSLGKTYKLGDTGVRAKTYTVAVGTELPYAQFQEYGTSRTPPRPFAQPAFDKFIAETAWQSYMQRAVEGSITKELGFRVYGKRAGIDLRRKEYGRALSRETRKRVQKGTQRVGAVDRHHKKETNRLKREGNIDSRTIGRRLDAYEAFRIDYRGEFD